MVLVPAASERREARPPPALPSLLHGDVGPTGQASASRSLCRRVACELRAPVSKTTDAGKEGRMYDGSNEQGGRGANYASGAVRVLERRIRRLEEIVLNGRPADKAVTERRPTDDNRGSRS